jgi:hypothetical protein
MENINIVEKLSNLNLFNKHKRLKKSFNDYRNKQTIINIQPTEKKVKPIIISEKDRESINIWKSAFKIKLKTKENYKKRLKEIMDPTYKDCIPYIPIKITALEELIILNNMIKFL